MERGLKWMRVCEAELNESVKVLKDETMTGATSAAPAHVPTQSPSSSSS